MNLRAKALVSAVLLTTAVTGSLGYWVERQWETRERERIEQDLALDAADIDRHLLLTRRLTTDMLAQTTRERLDLRQFVRGTDNQGTPLKIASNFKPFIHGWIRRTGAQAGLVALDRFDVRPEREANRVAAFGDLIIVEHAGTLDVLGSKDLEDWILSCYETFFDDSTPRSTVLSLGRSAWLVVAAPLHKDAGQEELAGAALVFRELNTAWLQSTRAAMDLGVRHVIHAGGHVAATNLDDETTVRRVIDLAGQSGQVFEFSLDSSGVTERWIGMDHSFEPGRSPRLIALKNLDAELAPLNQLLIWLRGIGLGLGIVGTGFAYALALRVVRRLDRLRAHTKQVRAGNFEATVDVGGHDEVTALGRSFNRMTEGLRALGLYTDPVIARAILDDSGADLARGQRVTGTMLFTDIADYTTISERLDPDDLVSRLNRYFSVVGDAVKTHGGYLDKFIGDAVMAWWGPPFVGEGEGTEEACRSALAAMRALGDQPEFPTRMGLAYGEVIVGNLGSETKKNFTVIGDAANLASRLEGVNKVYGTSTLVEEEVVRRAPGIRFREIDRVIVKGRDQVTVIFEILGAREDRFDDTREDQWARYGEALALYRDRKFIEAADLLEDQIGCDGPSRWLSGVCREFVQHPPVAGWEPVTRLTTK